MSCTHGNLGPRAQDARLRGSIIGLAVALLASVLMLHFDVPAIYRVAVFVPFFFASFGAFGGLFRTCNFAAKEGVRITDHGEEVVVNPAERAQMRRDGRLLLVSSFATAMAATLVAVMLP